MPARSNARSTRKSSSVLQPSIAAVFAFAYPAAAQEMLPSIEIGASTDAAPARATNAPPAPQLARPDLQPDNVANAARVATSSRSHTQTFTRQDIEELNPQDVFGLLRNATSILVTYQGRKFPNNLKFRGDGNFGFIVDGAYVSAQTAGLMMQSLPVSALDQVDVVRDASALTLGPLVDFGSSSGALNSGFVVVRTHTPQETEMGLRTAVQTYGGVLGSAYGGYVFGRKPGEIPAFISGFIQKSSDDGPANRSNWNDTVVGLLKGGFTAGPLDTSWTLFQSSTRYGFQQGTFGEQTASTLAQKWGYSPIESTFLSWNSTFRWDERNVSLLTLAYTRTQDSNYLASFTSPNVTVANETGYTGQINARHSFTYDGTLAQLGLQYVNWSSPSGQTNYAGYARKEDTLSGYGNFEQKLLADRLILDASFRLDNHFDYVGVDQGGTTKYFYNRGFPLAVNYAGGATVKPLQGWGLGEIGAPLGAVNPLEGLANVSFSGRYSHTEQSDMSGIIADTNVTLQPEKQDKYEASVKIPVFRWFMPEVTYFDTEIQNNKQPSRTVTLNGNNVTVWTQGDTSRKGIEAVAAGVLLQDDILGKTTYRSSYTRLTEAYSHSQGTYDWLNPYRFQTPRTQINFALTQAWDRFTGTVALNHVSMYWSNGFAADGLYHQVGNYTTLDANIAYNFQLMDWDARLSFYGRNITNKRYESIYTYKAWGAVWGSELKLSWGEHSSPAPLPGMAWLAAAADQPSPWSGLYAGLNVGGVFGDGHGVNTVPGTSTILGDGGDDKGAGAARPATFFGRASASSAASTIPMGIGGGLGGAQLGYNWRLRPEVIGGFEADLQGVAGASASGSALRSATEPVTGATVVTSTKATKSLSYLGTARGRIGYLVTPTLLPYLTAGLAYGEGGFSTSLTQVSASASFAPNSGTIGSSSIRVGWAAGAGGEWMFQQNWSAKLEYIRYDLGNQGAYGNMGGYNLTAAGNPGLYASAVISSSRLAGHIVRAGVNYHFE
jgi:opacity protein-like surface antigen